MNSNKKEAKRILWIKIGTIIFAVAILGLWLANLRNVFASQEDQTTDATWQRISEEIKKIGNKQQPSIATATAVSENKFVTGMLNKANNVAANDEEKQMSGRLGNILDTAIASATATTTVKTEPCPKKIDCRPAAGQAKSCTIPVGCEGITKISH